jgi:predicted alpha/beta-hydrolase family hydrolase
MVAFARGLAARGLHIVTFDFPYVERGRRVPDGNETLESCWISVIESVRHRAGASAALFAGGKSMGGRIASQVAARPEAGGELSGLVFLGYPLHPAGQSKKDRTEHWPALHLPALFVQGSRDPFASPDQLHAAVRRLGGPATVTIVEQGDHSFKVPKGAGRSQDQVYAEVFDAVAAWCSGLLRHEPH